MLYISLENKTGIFTLVTLGFIKIYYLFTERYGMNNASMK